MATGEEHERRFAESFISARKRPRWLALLEAGRREELRRRLAHDLEKELDGRFIVALPSRWQEPAAAVGIIRRLSKAPTAWCMSENGEIDGRELDLHKALSAVIGFQMGTVLSIEPGELAYFEPELGEDRRWLLVHEPARRAALMAMIPASPRA